MLIAIEGSSGAGKTTVATKLVKMLTSEGYPCLYTREPGGTAKSEKIRERLRKESLTPLEQRRLFLEMRKDHEENIVVPAIEKGIIVVADRFRGAFLAYHGYRNGFPIEELEKELCVHTPGVIPDKTIFLNISPEDGLARKLEDVSILDSDLAGLTREYNGYLELAKRNNWLVIDATSSLSEVLNLVWRGIMC